MTTDEELTQLEETVRRLKIEYDIFFGGGSKKPPAEVEWRVQNLLRKFSDGQRLNFAQRFRFNTIQQRYALFNALWQQKLKIKEEGYRRPQDAMLGIQGLRTNEQHAAQEALSHHDQDLRPFAVHFSDPDSNTAQVETLYQALAEARKKSGDNSAGSLDSFRTFVRQKTAQLRKEYGCQAVEYSVETLNGQVKLKARPRG